MSLDDLSPSQIALMARLGAGQEREDAIGCEVAELSDPEVIEMRSLIGLGLAEMVPGWRGSVWFCLTAKAYRLIEEGLTE